MSNKSWLRAKISEKIQPHLCLFCIVTAFAERKDVEYESKIPGFRMLKHGGKIYMQIISGNLY